MIKIADIIAALEDSAPSRWQESFDNTGLQIGDASKECTGVLICVDASPEIVEEASLRGCNLIVSHHPLIFHAIKNITGDGRVERTIIEAAKKDIAIYSCHTSIDNAPTIGVSHKMAEMLGLKDVRALEERGSEKIGCGVVGVLDHPLLPEELAQRVKEAFGSPIVRCSSLSAVPGPIEKIGLCGGAGSFLIPEAVKAGAQAFITSDCKHNIFLDYLSQIFLIDIGHYESENCTKQIFYQIITEKFPNFAVNYSQLDKNPIIYL